MKETGFLLMHLSMFSPVLFKMSNQSAPPTPLQGFDKCRHNCHKTYSLLCIIHKTKAKVVFLQKIQCPCNGVKNNLSLRISLKMKRHCSAQASTMLQKFTTSLPFPVGKLKSTKNLELSKSRMAC